MKYWTACYLILERRSDFLKIYQHLFEIITSEETMGNLKEKTEKQIYPYLCFHP